VSRHAEAEPRLVDAGTLMAKPLWTIDDLSAYLSVPLATIYKWRSTGEAPGAVKDLDRITGELAAACWAKDARICPTPAGAATSSVLSQPSSPSSSRCGPGRWCARSSAASSRSR
jgi:hypothetical protein